MKADILKSDFRLPETVYIVGAGPSGNDTIKQIPDGAFVIALNRAIDQPINPAIWLCNNPYLTKADWFMDRMRKIEVEHRDLSWQSIAPGAPVIPVFAKHFLDQFPFVKCFFIPEGGEIRKPLRKSDGVLRVGATIAGVALQFCLFMGAKRVYLSGIDMKGGDFTGAPNPDPRVGVDGEWPLKECFDWINGAVQRAGMKVEKLQAKAEPKPAREPAPVIKPEPKRVNGAPTEAVPLPEVQSLMQPHAFDDLPAVAYICMSHDPVDCRNAIIDCLNQDYPDHLKTIYILHQRAYYTDDFPPPIKHNLEIKIVEINVDMDWPDGWLLKLMAFCDLASEPVTIWWDEDDRYPSNYIPRHRADPAR